METTEKKINSTTDGSKMYTHFSDSTNANFQYIQNQNITEKPKELASLKMIRTFSIIALILEILFIVSYIFNILNYNEIGSNNTLPLFVVFTAAFVIIALIFSKKRYAQFKNNPEVYSENSAKKIKKYRKFAQTVFIIFIFCCVAIIVFNVLINIGLLNNGSFENIDRWENNTY